MITFSVILFSVILLSCLGSLVYLIDLLNVWGLSLGMSIYLGVIISFIVAIGIAAIVGALDERYNPYF